MDVWQCWLTLVRKMPIEYACSLFLQLFFKMLTREFSHMGVIAYTIFLVCTYSSVDAAFSNICEKSLVLYPSDIFAVSHAHVHRNKACLVLLVKHCLWLIRGIWVWRACRVRHIQQRNDIGVLLLLYLSPAHLDSELSARFLESGCNHRKGTPTEPAGSHCWPHTCQQCAPSHPITAQWMAPIYASSVPFKYTSMQQC